MLKEILLKHINRSIFLESLVSDMGHYFFTACKLFDCCVYKNVKI